MTDPLGEVVTLLQPAATRSKLVGASGRWRLRRMGDGDGFYCVVIQGACRLASAGQAPIELATGDFVLVPSAREFTMTSTKAPPPNRFDEPIEGADGQMRLGDGDGSPDVSILVGRCAFGSADAAMLVALLPPLIHVPDGARLATLVAMVRDETLQTRPARVLVLARLLEVLLIEALRSRTQDCAAPGLVRGLSDPRLAAAIRSMHEAPARAWTVAELAKMAGLSRSTFFERFRQAIGLAPIDYLLNWRMAMAQNLLSQRQASIAEVAKRVGYGSASAFSVAFARHVGTSPGRFAAERPPARAGRGLTGASSVLSGTPSTRSRPPSTPTSSPLD